MDSTRCAVKLERLRQHLIRCGGSPDLINGWGCVEVRRSSGTSAGSTDFYFETAQGKRFRSQTDVVRHFDLTPPPPPPLPSSSSSSSAACKRTHATMAMACDSDLVMPSSSSDPSTFRTYLVRDDAFVASVRSHPPREVKQRSLGIVIGQAPPIHTGADFVPLSGLPEKRLARLAGLEICELWQRFERRNLLDNHPGRKFKADKHQRDNGYRLHQSTGDEFPKELAREAAAGVDLSGYGLAVLLGLQVASAFQVKAKLLTLDYDTLACPAIVLPHTSGVSHFWNDADNVAAAEAAFRDAIAQCLGKRSRFFS